MEDSWFYFPHVPESVHVAVEQIARSLDPLLLPSSTPGDVQAFQSPEGNAEGSFLTRKGASTREQVSFALASWLHCQLPSGALDISTLLVMSGSETEVPHFLFEFIQISSQEVILLLDLIPRKDLVQNPDYLHEFYQDTKLEQLRQQVNNTSASQVYVPSSLYVRALLSPTALLCKLKFSSVQELGQLVCPIIEGTFTVWFTSMQRKRLVQDPEEKVLLARRDFRIKSEGLEMDLTENLPKLFGDEIAKRVLAAFTVHD